MTLKTRTIRRAELRLLKRLAKTKARSGRRTRRVPIAIPVPIRLRRARQRKRVVPALSNTSVQYPSATQNDLELMQRSDFATAKYSDPWVHCRMDPFTSRGATQKPDGRGSRSVIVDHMFADNITMLNAGGFVIQTFPGMIPVTAGITGVNPNVADISVNGLSVVGTLDTGVGGNLYPLGVLREWAPNGVNGYSQWSPIGGVSANDPYTSAKFRVLSVKRRLRYIGLPTQASGLISVTPSPYALADTSTITTSASAAANLVSMITKNKNQANSQSVTTAMLIRGMDYEYAPSPLFTKDTVEYPAPMNVTILSKQSGDTHEFTPMPDFGVLIAPNQTLNSIPAGANLVGLFTDAQAPGTNAPIGVYGVDKSWIGEVIQVSGLQAGVTLRFEQVVCVEYEVQSASPFSPLSVLPPPARLRAVELAHQMANSLPVATPGASAPVFRM